MLAFPAIDLKEHKDKQMLLLGKMVLFSSWAYLNDGHIDITRI